MAISFSSAELKIRVPVARGRNLLCLQSNKHNIVITTGYNGFLKGAPHVSRVRNGHEQFTIHAEQNAICDAAGIGVPMNNAIEQIIHT